MNFIRQVRFFDDLPKDSQVDKIAGLVYSPKAQQFLISEDGSANFEKISTAEDRVGSVNLPSSFKAINTAFDPKQNRLLALDPPGNTIITVAANANGNLIPMTLTEVDVKSWGVQNARGLTVAADGTLYILDGAAKEIVQITPNSDGSFAGASLSRFDIPKSVNNPSGIAIDPSTNHLHVLSPNQKRLYELDKQGKLIATRNLSGLDLKDPQALVFAPSGDSTDPANRTSLYVADSNPTSGGIVELSFTQPLTLQPTTMATLVQTIDASQWNPPSPDSSGIAYIPASNRLLIADGEVNEIPTLFTGDNLFESSLSGNLTNTGSATAYSNEPTGVDINPANGHLFLSDDNADKIFQINPVDGVYGNANDILVGSFDTRVFGSDDPEGVAFVPSLGHLFIADGVDNQVYRVTTGGTLVSQFDTASLGVSDPEGIVYNPDTGNLFIVGEPEDAIAEVTVGGTLVDTIDIGAANADKPAGLAYAPGSQNPAQNNIYVAARGVDNNSDPNENDGRIYELSLNTIEWPTDGLYFSTSGSGSVGGVSFKDEDIFVLDDVTGNWLMYFDGSDVGLTASGVDVDAFYINDDGSILLSVDRATTIPDVGAIEDADIVKFIPATLGSNTTGTYEWYLDGSDVGLDSDSDDIDAISFAPDDRLVISTRGSATVPGGLSPFPQDEDLLAFQATTLGANTSGTWQFYFDGSDVGLTASDEDVSGLWIDSGNGDIYLATNGAFDVPGVSGDGSDVFKFAPTSLGGGTTSGTFSAFFDGSANGLAGEVVDGFARLA